MSPACGICVFACSLGWLAYEAAMCLPEGIFASGAVRGYFIDQNVVASFEA